MTDKDLKRLRRDELLEMLIAQSRKTEELQAELDAARAQLASRDILIQEAGSIAEAALRINGVFEAAQAAAEQYLENIRRVSGVSPEEASEAKPEGEIEANNADAAPSGDTQEPDEAEQAKSGVQSKAKPGVKFAPKAKKG